MKKILHTKTSFGILIFLTLNFLILNLINISENNQERVGILNQDVDHPKLSDDLPGSYFHREVPTGFEAFPSSPNIYTLIIPGGTLQDAVKDNDYYEAGVRNDATGFFGVNFTGYSDFEPIMHDDISYIEITYRIIFTYNIELNASNFVFTIHCDNGTSQSITLFDFAYDYIEFEDSLIINETNFNQVFQRVKDGGYIDSFKLSATTYYIQQFIYVNYFDIYYWYPKITSHDPIVITNDSEFTPANGVINGTGTYNDPWIIGNWSINAGWSGSCIYITGTTDYFRIENCILKNSGNSVNDAAIRLYDSDNGNIYNNTCSDNLYNGIDSKFCANINITNNRVFNNTQGIYLSGCDYLNASYNRVYNNSYGIVIGNGDYLTISNNIFYDHIHQAIHVDSSYNMNVSCNTCFNNLLGINGEFVYDSSFNGNNCSNNAVWGIEIAFGNNLSITENFCGFNPNKNIELYDCENCKVVNNTCRNSNNGIYLDNYYNSELSDNDCIFNSNGIFVDNSNSSRFYQNNFSNNLNTGIYISNSENNYYYYNIISNNQKAIELTSSIENYIYENWIWNNTNNFIGSIDGNYIYNNYFFPIEEFDTDGDGLTDIEELIIGTNPSLVDTDEDNFLDGYEHEYGSNPLDPSSFPKIWKDDFDLLMQYLEGNWTLLQKVIDWSQGNATLIDNIILQLEQNATLLQEVIGWLGENATEIELLFTYLEGNATLLVEIINDLETNASLLNIVYAIATQNEQFLSQLNSTLMNQNETIQLLRDTLDKLGVSIGDIDYDGLDDLDEISYGTNPTMIDTDLDNLNDAFEIKYGTDPLDDDTDDDGSYDGVEVASGTDPLDPDDYPGKVGGGANTVVIIGTIIGIVSVVAVGIMAGIFFYLKRQKRV